MTAQEFIAAYPTSPIRTGYLEDMACAFCGNRDRLDMDITKMCSVHDHEIDAHGDNDIVMDAYCRCPECDDDGAVRDFYIEGLDDLIRGGDLPAPAQPAADATAPSAESAHFMP